MFALFPHSVHPSLPPTGRLVAPTSRIHRAARIDEMWHGRMRRTRESYIIIQCFISELLVGSMALDLLQHGCLSFRDIILLSKRIAMS